MIGPFRSIGEYSNPLYFLPRKHKKYIFGYIHPRVFFPCTSFQIASAFHAGFCTIVFLIHFTAWPGTKTLSLHPPFICSVTDVGIQKGSRTTIHSKIFQCTILSIFESPFASPFKSYLFFNHITRWPGVWWLPLWPLQHKELSLKLSTQD